MEKKDIGVVICMWTEPWPARHTISAVCLAGHGSVHTHR